MMFSNGLLENDESKKMMISEFASEIMNETSDKIISSANQTEEEKNPFDRVENNSLYELEFDMGNIDQNPSVRDSSKLFDEY